MNAIHVQGSNLVWAEAPDPVPGGDEVLIRVHAAGVNRADLLQARGHYPPPPGSSEILGLEVAGEIEWVGRYVENWKPGDRVCGLIPGGGYAEKAKLYHGVLLAIPDNWSFGQAAAVPEAWLTAYVNLFMEGLLVSGQSVLIHAGASGVGTAAIQLARATGAVVFVTAGSEEKLAVCRELGAHHTINYKTSDFSEVVLETTKGAGVDLILDCVGGAYLARNISALKRFGRLVNIGLLGGAKGELDLNQVLRKRLHIVGSTLRSRHRAEHGVLTQLFHGQHWPKLVSGEFRIVIDREFPIQQAGGAHAYVAANRNTGKVVLTCQ